MEFFIDRESCPACEAKKCKTIFSAPFDGPPIRQYLESFYGPLGKIQFQYLHEAAYILCECKKCGLIYQKEIPNEDLMKKLYQEWLDPQLACAMQTMAKRDLDYHINDAGEIMMLIAYLGYNPANLDFLDFGMGWGCWGLMAKAFGCNVSGTELSKIKFDYCRSQGINAVSFSDLASYTFDFINTEQVFEHISKPLDTLRFLKESLKPKGLIKISVPDGGDIKRRLSVNDWTAKKYTKNSLNAVSPLEHINCFSRRTIIKMAKAAGLQEIKIPISLQYIYGINWKPFRPLGYTLLRPFYRNILKKGTFLFFCNRGKS